MVLFGSWDYSTVGFILSKGIALTYLIAFTIFYKQFSKLVGEKGLEPIREAKEDKSFLELFSIFYFISKDWFIDAAALTGILFSLLILSPISLIGPNVLIVIWIVLWLLFISFLNSGQVFTNPGWQLILSEAGFLAIFLAVPGFKVPELLILLFRWILFRMMLGSGIVKLRGGEGWKNFDSLFQHFESQPFPGPLSWKFHNLPDKILRFGAFLMETSMLVVPFLYFLPQPFAAIGGILTILMQIMIALGGNYAWLNLITSVLAISTFNNQLIERFIGLSVQSANAYPYSELVFFVAIVIGLYSTAPVRNFFSKNPLQNASFNPFNLVNSYGAFPKVMEDHYELIIEGRKEGEKWKEYILHSSFKDQKSRPRQISPYHYMLEYLIDFYLHDNLEDDSWIEELLEKLLKNEKQAVNLFKETPFNGSPPDEIRAVRYEYRFTTPEERQRTGKFWERDRKDILIEKS